MASETSDTNLLLKVALQCELIILNMLQYREENELIVRYVQFSPLEQRRRVVGVSPFGTWGSTPKTGKGAGGEAGDPVELLVGRK